MVPWYWVYNNKKQLCIYKQCQYHYCVLDFVCLVGVLKLYTTDICQYNWWRIYSGLLISYFKSFIYESLIVVFSIFQSLISAFPPLDSGFNICFFLSGIPAFPSTNQRFQYFHLWFWSFSISIYERDFHHIHLWIRDFSISICE